MQNDKRLCSAIHCGKLCIIHCNESIMTQWVNDKWEFWNANVQWVVPAVIKKLCKTACYFHYPFFSKKFLLRIRDWDWFSNNRSTCNTITTTVDLHFSVAKMKTSPKKSDCRNFERIFIRNQGSNHWKTWKNPIILRNGFNATEVSLTEGSSVSRFREGKCDMELIRPRSKFNSKRFF